MSKDSLVILKAFGCFIGATLTCFITFGVAFADTILFPEDKFSEQGLVENTQTFLLLASAAVYCWIFHAKGSGNPRFLHSQSALRIRSNLLLGSDSL